MNVTWKTGGGKGARGGGTTSLRVPPSPNSVDTYEIKNIPHSSAFPGGMWCERQQISGNTPPIRNKATNLSNTNLISAASPCAQTLDINNKAAFTDPTSFGHGLLTCLDKISSLKKEKTTTRCFSEAKVEDRTWATKTPLLTKTKLCVDAARAPSPSVVFARRFTRSCLYRSVSPPSSLY